MTSGRRNANGKSWKRLIERFESRNARVGVVGLGYVGLPVAVDFGKAGFRIIGVDASEARVQLVVEGRSEFVDVLSEDLVELRDMGRLDATTSYDGLSEADAVLLCVPTPLLDGIPDVSAITQAATSLAAVLRPGTLVILESTTYPGTTEDLVAPLLELGGLVRGRDFLLAFSPERIDPGNPQYSFADIPKIVGGTTPAATKAAEALYSQVVPKVVTVKSPREAEMAKLIENTFRHVNIALVNELALYAHDMQVDIWEAIEAAATKPFGYMPFFPGPGWGGHCIPLDPAYLSWRVHKDRNHNVRFVEIAHQVNSEMPRHVVSRVSELLNKGGKAIKNSRILGVGIAYKGGTEDTRHSPGVTVLDILARQGAKINYHDPLVHNQRIAGKELKSAKLSPSQISKHDLILILARQTGVDWDQLANNGTLIFDTVNALRRARPNIVRL